jgi:hypothetical protein
MMRLRQIFSAISLRSRAVVSILVLAGLAFQLRQYLANRSVSLDESFLTLNISNRSLEGLLHRLDYNQAAPPVFLAAQKAIEAAFGENEYFLRLLPLLAAFCAVALFPFLARRVVGSWAVPVAVALFILSDPLIYYSSIAKQYSADVAITVFSYWLVMRLRSRLDKTSSILTLGVYALIAPWISFPALFIAFGISTVFGARALTERRWRAGLAGFAAGGACLVNVLVALFIAHQQLAHLQASIGRTSLFLGASPSNWHILATAGKLRFVAGINHVDIFGQDIEKAVALAAVAFCLTGLASLLRHQTEKALLLLSPVVFLLVAAYAHQYPLFGRTMLFLAPIVVLLLAEGVVVLLGAARHPFARGLVAIIGVAIIVSVGYKPVRHLTVPRTEEEMKPVMAYLARHQRPSDTLFIYYPSQYGFRYYLECSCGPKAARDAYSTGLWPARFAAGGQAQYAPALSSTPPHFLVARFRDRDPQSYTPDLEHLRGRHRVWILSSDIPADTRQRLVDVLDRLGQHIATFRGGDDESSAFLYLYDFSA